MSLSAPEGQPRTPKAMGDGDGIGGAQERETGCQERLIITKKLVSITGRYFFKFI